MEIVSHNIKNFEYRTPKISVDSNGESQVEFADSRVQKNIPSITLLYRIKYDDNGGIISVEGIDIANTWLMYLHIEKDLECTSSQSRALLIYFDFLNRNSLQWDIMPYRQSRRPTYQFKRYLEDLHRDRTLERPLSVSTTKAYMRNIVSFYKHHVVRGYRFENPPFEYEDVAIQFDSGATYMQRKSEFRIQTTDLRIKLANPQKKHGVPNYLRALSKYEWAELDKLLRKDRRVIRSSYGLDVYASLPIECSLMFLVCRYSGVRRSEVSSFNTSLIFKPAKEELDQGYIDVRIGPAQGVSTKYGKERIIEMPSHLMLKLHEYKESKRFSTRCDKFIKKHDDTLPFTPLFINNCGRSINEATLNARWCEIKKTMTKRLGRPFDHKAHNLRPSYAVHRLCDLIDAGVNQSDALSLIQGRMGHSSLSTTLHYLKQSQNPASASESAEIIMTHLIGAEELEF